MYKDQKLIALKRKTWFQTLLVLLVIGAVFFTMVNVAGLVAGNAFYNYFCVRYTRFDLQRFQPLQATLAAGIQHKNWQNIDLESRLGYTLAGTYLPNPTPTNNTVVFVHGIAGSRLMGLWYAPIYWDAGYNVLIYDSRASGDSGGTSITWGYYERYDLDQWIDWLEQRNPGGIIGVHGVSMGAATALMHAEMNESNQRVSFYIADSAYADLEELLTQQIDAAVNLHSPLWVKLLLWYTNLAANWQENFRFADISPLRSVKNTTTPILYLHGQTDALVPVSMSEQLYTATKGYKQKYFFPHTAHALAIFTVPSEYRQQIVTFLASLPPAQR